MKEYFSHDYNARNDSKVVNLLMKKGLSGIGLYWCLSEMLYECNGFIMLNECERIAFELRINENEIFNIINEFDLFKKDKKKFWSDTILKRLDLRKEKSEKAKQSALVRWNNANAIRMQNDSNAIKEKKSKVKENKVNILIPSFLEFKNYVLEKESLIDLKALKFKYDSWIENNWQTGKDKKITNWKTTILNTLQYLPKTETKQNQLSSLEIAAKKTEEKLNRQ